jgi:hypothetical protein
MGEKQPVRVETKTYLDEGIGDGNCRSYTDVMVMDEDDKVLWKKSVSSATILFHIPKPGYARRIKKMRVRAQKVVSALNAK